MVSWTNYTMGDCPYPLTVGLERFHTPQGVKYAVLLRYQEDPQAAPPDLGHWFRAYNQRGNIEAGIKQEKTVFHLQHLWSRHLVGMQIQLALALFAANFIAGAQAWVRERLVVAQNRGVRLFERVKGLVRVATNSAALVELQPGQVLVRFSATSSLAGVVIRLTAGAVQLALPLVGSPRVRSG
jgi:hypothetical protein